MNRAKKDNVIDMKPEIGYAHPKFMAELAYAQQAGARKYGKLNFTQGHSEVQLIEATIRHLQAYLWEGELDKDCTERLGHPVSHLGCAAANLNMLLAQDALGSLEKDAFFRTLKLGG